MQRKLKSFKETKEFYGRIRKLGKNKAIKDWKLRKLMRFGEGLGNFGSGIDHI